MRCRIIAEAAQTRWPNDRIVFMLSRHAPYADDAGFETIKVDGSPTFHTSEVNSFLRDEKPDVVVFDNSGRNAQLRCAWQNGASIVYISSRNDKRKKLFRIDRTRFLTQHWIAQSELLVGGLSRWESIKVRITTQKDPIFFSTVYHESEPARRLELRKKLGLADHPYLLFCHGGGDLRSASTNAPIVFARAANRITRTTDLKAVVVLGYSISPDAVSDLEIVARPTLPHSQFIDLLHDAELIVSGGGAGLNGQILAHRKLNVATPFSRDQVKRLRRCKKLGLLETTVLDEDSIVAVTRELMNDRKRQTRIKQRIEVNGFCNGLPAVIKALAALRRERSHQNQD
jgi:hypothetical protein